jgi:hypothetical protein
MGLGVAVFDLAFSVEDFDPIAPTHAEATGELNSLGVVVEAFDMAANGPLGRVAILEGVRFHGVTKPDRSGYSKPRIK